MTVKTFFAACFSVAGLWGTSSLCQVAVNDQGEMVINIPGETAAIYRTEIIEWICEDPVEIVITKTLREDRTFKVARISVKIAKFNASQSVVAELASYADRPFFDITPKCDVSGPVAFVTFADRTSDNGDGTGIAYMNTDSIFLRKAEPLNAD